MSFIAQWPGPCGSCLTDVEGKACMYIDDQIYHEICPPTVNDTTLSRHEVNCACGLIHAGECP